MPRIEVLLESVSPYGSRRVTVECDGEATAAYLRDDTSVIAATWIANHRSAPETTDRERLTAGLAPLMPLANTRRPRGRSRPDPATLEAIWFEEGDGVAITERGTLLAVLPGWASSSRGMPGYSRDIVGQTPFGWSLDDAIEGLAPRVQRARAFWQWRESAGGWGRFQQAALAHLESRIGPAGHYWDASTGAKPSVGISERPPAPGRPYTVLATVGMSCQRMPVVEQVLDDPRDYARVELALATTMPSAAAARIFPWLATYPWRAVTWFGPGHTVRWYAEPDTFPLGPGYQAVLLLDDASPLAPPEMDAPDLTGFTVGDDPVRWLWIVPITERTRVLAKERGSVSAVTRLATEGRTWIASA
ncbi:MAG: suppressor of fused domain protein [Streptosporangiaceae bacterium]